MIKDIFQNEKKVRSMIVMYRIAMVLFLLASLLIIAVPFHTKGDGRSYVLPALFPLIIAVSLHLLSEIYVCAYSIYQRIDVERQKIDD